MDTDPDGLLRWSDLLETVKSRGLTWEAPHLAALSRAHARVRVARHIEVSFGDRLADATGEGYQAIFRVAMAYAALEAVADAIWRDREFEPRLKAHQINVTSEECAETFRKSGCERFRSALTSYLTSPRLITDVKALMETGTNVSPIAQGVRHLAFHGVFTPGTISYKRGGGAGAHVRDTLNLLHGSVLESIDSYFDSWLCALVTRPA